MANVIAAVSIASNSFLGIRICSVEQVQVDQRKPRMFLRSVNVLIFSIKAKYAKLIRRWCYVCLIVVIDHHYALPGPVPQAHRKSQKCNSLR